MELRAIILSFLAAVVNGFDDSWPNEKITNLGRLFQVYNSNGKFINNFDYKLEQLKII